MNKQTVFYAKFTKGKIDKIKRKANQLTELMEDNCHIPDMVQTFTEEHGGLNLVFTT